jgi:hypothetical protein
MNQGGLTVTNWIARNRINVETQMMTWVSMQIGGCI